MTSRWAHWSRGTQDKKTFDNLFEANPTGTGIQSPGDKAAAMGLVSDGKGGYRDKESGQLVARTVNNELVFYDPGPTGGVVADGNGGAYVTQAQPSWRDPRTGMAMTPPHKPESPAEIAAVPYPTPATAPMGFNAFMKKKSKDAYNMQNPMPMRQPADAEQGEGDIQAGPMGEDYKEFGGNAGQGPIKRQVQKSIKTPNTNIAPTSNPAAGLDPAKVSQLRQIADRNPNKTAGQKLYDVGIARMRAQMQQTAQPQNPCTNTSY